MKSPPKMFSRIGYQPEKFCFVHYTISFRTTCRRAAATIMPRPGMQVHKKYKYSRYTSCTHMDRSPLCPCWPASTTNQSGLVTLPLTFWPWKWCPSHVWRGLPLLLWRSIVAFTYLKFKSAKCICLLPVVMVLFKEFFNLVAFVLVLRIWSCLHHWY